MTYIYSGDDDDEQHDVDVLNHFDKYDLVDVEKDLEDLWSANNNVDDIAIGNQNLSEINKDNLSNIRIGGDNDNIGEGEGLVKMNNPSDIFEEYIEQLDVTFEDFERYEEIETQEVMKEISVSNRRKYVMIIVLVIGIFLPPVLFVNVIREFKRRKSEKLATLYHTTLFVLFVYSLIVFSLIMVGVMYLINLI
ncbi:Uncharacterized protein QTN25_001863 [Entamoeba marina]